VFQLDFWLTPGQYITQYVSDNRHMSINSTSSKWTTRWKNSDI